MKNMNKDSIDWRFKFLYFIAIISVIVGHCNDVVGINLFYDWFIPYVFHLPLFAFSSGYFYKESYTDRVGSYIIHKIKTLIIPLYLWHLFYGLVVIFLRKFGFTIGEDFTLYNLLIDPIMTGHAWVYDLGGWFIWPLFMTQVFNVLLRKLLKKVSIPINNYFIFIFYLILGIVGILLGKKELNTGVWLVLLRLLRLLPYYGLGILYKSKLEEKDKLPSILYFTIIFLMQLIIITLNGSSQVRLGLVWCNDVYVFRPYIASFLGIAFWLRIANILLPIINENKYIKLVCDNSYSIMINQFAGFMFIKTIWLFIYICTPIQIDFDIQQYKSNIWYYFSLNYNMYILYIAAGLVIPILMQSLVTKLKTTVKVVVMNNQLLKGIMSI